MVSPSSGNEGVDVHQGPDPGGTDRGVGDLVRSPRDTGAAIGAEPKRVPLVSSRLGMNSRRQLRHRLV